LKHLCGPEMAPAFSATFTVVAALVLGASATNSAVRENERSLLQSWTGVLDKSSGKDTPVTRVVNLLKEMSKTVQAEMDEDEGLYRKLKCWCNDNNWEKGNSIEKSEAKISELQSTIESLTGSTAELRSSIKELEAELAADKKALAEATALRNKQLDEFHNLQKDEIQNIENLKAALEVLEKHRDAPGSSVAGGPIFKTEKEGGFERGDAKLFGAGPGGASFLQVHNKDFPSRDMRSFDNFMRDSGLDETTIPVSVDVNAPVAKPKFLQQQDRSSGLLTEWSSDDLNLVQQTLKSASAFLQAKHGQTYYPAYNFRSNEIVGVLSQMKEEMEGDLAEAQKEENQRAAAFAELRAAKKQEIDSGYRMSEEKEDQLAEQDNALAEAKEDLEQEEASLAADQKFVKNLKETCADADKNYDIRKAARQQEQTAISQTMNILTGDEARDAMSGTFSFVQVSSSSSQHRRQAAAQALRRAARKAQDPQLSVLATAVELDAFTKVKKAIDDMIAILTTQQEDEVKKTDWCKAELQDNEMATARGETKQADIEAAIAKLDSDIKELEAGIADAKSNIASSQLALQRATMNRKQDNLDFQKTVSDQMVTIEVLKKAMDKLATFYDLVQTDGQSWIQQTPPVPQSEYSKSKGASGVMEMIEKLIHDSQELMSDSKKAESEAQLNYETLIADTNAEVKALQEEIVSKTQAKVDAEKDRRDAKADLTETIRMLEGLAKYNAEMHAECDYVLKNFDLRQQARRDEIVALQQAKQILNGASLS